MGLRTNSTRRRVQIGVIGISAMMVAAILPMAPAGAGATRTAAAPHPALLPDPPAVTLQQADDTSLTLPFGGAVVSTGTADMNGDGKPDVVAVGEKRLADSSAHEYIWTLLGNGDGTFAVPIEIELPDPSTGRPSTVLVDDFDGDGHPDAVVSMPQAGHLYLFHGEPDGTFGPATLIGSVGTPTLVRTADLRGSGHLDLVVISNATMSILMGNGDGTFGAPVSVSTFGGDSRSIAFGDFTGDGKVDIAVAQWGSFNQSLALFVNDGNGNFPATPTTTNLHMQLSAIRSGDFDGDGELDLVALGNSDGSCTTGEGGCSVFVKGNGDGTFATPNAQQPIGVFVEAGTADEVAATPLFGGAHADVVLSSISRPGDVVVGRNDGAGSFTWSKYAAGYGRGALEFSLHAAVVGAFSGPGTTDIVVGGERPGPSSLAGRGSYGGGLAIVRENPNMRGTYLAPKVIDAPRGVASQAVLGDFRGTGNLDLLYQQIDGNGALLPGNGDGTFGAPISNVVGFGCNSDAGSIATADFDVDSRLDVVNCGGRVSFGVHDQSGTFDSAVDLAPATASWHFRNVQVADMNGDGHPDIVALATNDCCPSGGNWLGEIDVLRYNPADPRHFLPPVRYDLGELGNNPGFAMALGDVDGDGHVDVVTQTSVVTGDPLRLRVFHGLGDGTLGTPTDTTPSLPSLTDLHLADMTGSGYLDLVGVFYASLYVATGDGHGAFAVTTPIGDGGNGSGPVAIADLNGDGHPDIVTSDARCCFPQNPHVLLGRGDGTFSDPVPVKSGDQASLALVGTLRPGSLPDLVFISTNGSAPVTVVANLGLAGSAAPPQLAISNVTSPAAVAAGADVTVGFDVTNAGGPIASGQWTDAVYLSTDDTWSIDDVPLAAAIHTAPLVSGGHYHVSVTAPAVPLADGAQHLVIRTDAGNAVSPGSPAGRSAASAISISIPTLAVGTPIATTITAGARRFVRVDVPANTDVAVDVATSATGDSQMFASSTGVPTAAAHELEAIDVPSGRHLVLPGRATATTWYLVAVGLASTSLTWKATLPGLAIEAVSPNTIGATGRSTVVITGSAFGSDATIELRAGVTVVSPVAVVRTSSTTMTATFALNNFPLTGATLSVTSGGDTADSAPITVVAPSDLGRLDISAIASPGTLRLHEKASFTLTLTNSGDTDVLVPVLRVLTDKQSVKWLQAPPNGPDSDDYVHGSPQQSGVVFFDQHFEIGGIQLPTAVVPPHSTVTMHGMVEAPPLPPHNTATAYVTAWTSASDRPMNFATTLAPFRPDGMSDASWSRIVAQFVTDNGSTMREFATQLVDLPAAASEAGVTLHNENEAIDFMVHRALDHTPGAPVDGTIISSGGPSSSNTEVDIVDVATGATFTATTWYDGTFSIWDVPAGTYRLTVPGHTPRLATTITVDAVNGAHGIPVTVGAGATLSGTVRAPGGAPIAGAVVTASDQVGMLASVPTGPDGAYTIVGVADGPVTMSAVADGSAPSTDETVTVAGDTTHDVTLAQGLAVSGTVLDSMEQPVADAVIMARSSSGATTDRVVSAADGTFTLTALSAGSYTLSAIDSKMRISTGASATAGATPVPVVLHVVAAATVSGTIRDDTGAPVAGVAVSTDAAGFGGSSAMSAPDGSFTLGPIPPGVQQLSITADQDRFSPVAAVPVNPAAGAVLIVPITLSTIGDLALTARSGTGALLGHQVLVVAGPNPLDGGATTQITTITTDASGLASLSRRLPGDYTISARGAADVHAHMGVGSAGASATIVVQTSDVTGRVVTTLGQPVGSVIVTISDAGGLAASILTADDGTYRFRAIASGPFVAQVSGAVFGVSAQRSFTVQIGQATQIPDLVQGGSSVAIQVSDGVAAVPGATVELDLLANPSAAKVFATSDAAGTATFTGLIPGDYALTAGDATRTSLPSRVTVVGTSGTFATRLQPGYALSGVVRDANGQPVSNAVVRAVSSTHVAVGGLSLADGTYRLTGLPAGIYSLSVSDFRNTPTLLQGVVVPTSSGAGIGPRVESAPAVDGTVSTQDVTVGGQGQEFGIVINGQPAETFVTVRDAAETPVATAGGTYDSEVHGNTITLGEELPSGDYTAEVSIDGRVTDSAFTVGSNSTQLQLDAHGGSPVVTDPAPPGGPGFGEGAGELLRSWLGNSPVEPHRQDTDLYQFNQLRTIGDLLRIPDCPEVSAAAAAAAKLKHIVDDRYANWETAYDLFWYGRIENTVILGAAANKILADMSVVYKAFQIVKGLSPILESVLGLPAAVVAVIGDLKQHLWSQITDGFGVASAGLDSLALVLSAVSTGLANNAKAIGITLASDVAADVAGFISAVLDVRNLIAEDATVANSIRSLGSGPAEQQDLYLQALARYHAQLAKAKAAQYHCPPPATRNQVVPTFTTGTKAEWSVVAPGDPNDIVGPAGAGASGWLLDRSDLGYIVHFENVPSATAAAVAVTATTTLPLTVDLATFELGDITFGATTVSVPPGLQAFHRRLDLRATIGGYVDVDASLDPSTRIVTWSLVTIDPTSGLPDRRIEAGFLPPEDGSGAGDGSVAFSVNGLSGQPTATTIDMQASIVFDDLAAINTNVWTNTLDVDPPNAVVAVLPATSPASVPVSWAGTDQGSGIATYDVWVSADGTPLVKWLTATSLTSAVYPGIAGHAYGFAATATDTAGNSEPDDTAVEATTVAQGHVVPTAQITMSAGVAGPLSVTADASASTSDPLSSIVSATWDFGDGTPTVAGSTVGHVYMHHGSFTITLAVTDGAASTGSTSVDVVVVSAPHAVADTASALADTTLHVAGPGLLVNDVVVDSGDTLSAVLVAPGTHGSVTVQPDGGFDFQPYPGFTGTDVFTYRVIDQNQAASAQATVIVTVRSAPVLSSLAVPATAMIGIAYGGHTFGVSGFPRPSFSISSGALPTGLTLDTATGALGGTPTALGVFTFRVAAQNGIGVAATSGDITITIIPVPVPVPPPTDVVPPGASSYTSLIPARLLDTRSAGGSPIPATTVTKVQVVGRGGVPSTGVSAVVVNVTATNAAGPGYLTVYSGQTARPLASNLNVERVDQTVSNLVTVPVALDGTISIYTQSGADLVVDVEGFYSTTSVAVAAGRLVSMTPTRLLDTRTNDSPLVAGETRLLDVTGLLPVGANPTAVVLDVVATEANGPGFVTVHPSGTSRPGTSNLNLAGEGDTVSNLVEVAVGADGKVALYSQSGTHLVVDLAGWYTSAAATPSVHGLYVPVDGTRLLDTRDGGLPAAGSTLTVAIPFAAAGAVVLNLTATQASRPGFLSAWPSSVDRPFASVLNVARRGQTVAGAVIVGTGTANAVDIFEQSDTHLVVDINGYFTR